MNRLAHVGLTCLVVLSQPLFQRVLAGDGWDARSQGPASPRQLVNRPDLIVTRVLRANPLTGPYPIKVDWRGGSVILSGAVGTSQIHDMAVRAVIDLGYPVKDDLVIDTAEAHRVALIQAAAIPGISSSWGGMLAGSAPYFVYPPPLFGRVDDPFFGFEPPLVSFPPWARSPNLDQTGRGPTSAPAGGLASPGGYQGAPAMGRGQASPVNGPPPVKGRLQLSVDMSGQVFLSGVVATEADKRIIEEEARNTPGVSQVHSDIRVQQGGSDTPPPPPQPVLRVEPEARPAAPAPAAETKPVPAPQPPAPKGRASGAGLALARDIQPLSRRVTDALAKRPAVATLPIGVQSREGIVTVSGKVPSAYEAMLVYRTVEQTPGVRDVVDRLEFQLPDENHPNPLRKKGRPEDVEPYLTSQIRRHLGDLAHVDRVRIRGDSIEIRGSLLRAEDQNRVQAILRSIPLLRDFRLEPVFSVD